MSQQTSLTALPGGCTAILLTGGKSRRMGEDKASLLLHGQTWWERQLTTLHALPVERVVISGRADGPYVRAGTEMMVDQWPNCGPLGGLATVLTTMRTKWAVVLAIDLPRVESGFLRELMALAAERGTGLVPWAEDCFHPLAAVYPQAAGELARERLERGELALQGWVREMEQRGWIQRWVVPEPALLANVNTPEDLAALEG